MTEIAPRFFAPTPAQIDWSPIQQGAQATAAAYMAAGEAVASGMKTAIDEQKQKEKEKDKTRLLGELENEKNYDTVNYTIADDKFPAIMQQYAGDRLAQSIKIAEALVAEGRTQTEADALAQQALTPIPQRILNPEGRGRIGRARAEVLGRGFAKPDEVRQILDGGDAFPTMEAAIAYRQQAARSLLQPDDPTWRAKMTMQLQNEVALVGARADAEISALRFQNAMQKDAAAAARSLDIATLPELEKKLSDVRAMAATKAANEDLELKKQLADFEDKILTKRQEKLQAAEEASRLKAIEAEGGQKIKAIEAGGAEDRKTLELKGAAGGNMSSAEQDALGRLFASNESDTPPLKDVPLLSLLGGNAIEALNRLRAAEGSEGLGDIQDMSDLSQIRGRWTPDGPVLEDKRVGTEAGKKKQIAAIEQLLSVHFGGRDRLNQALAVAQTADVTSMSDKALLEVLGSANPDLRAEMRDAVRRLRRGAAPATTNKNNSEDADSFLRDLGK